MRIDPKKPLTDDDQIRLGYAAKAVLADETLQLALDASEDDILRTWALAQTVQDRENEWGALQGLIRLQKRLEIWIQRANTIEQRREREAKRKQDKQ